MTCHGSIYSSRGIDEQESPRAESDRKLLRKLNDLPYGRSTDMPIIDTISKRRCGEKCVGSLVACCNL